MTTGVVPHLEALLSVAQRTGLFEQAKIGESKSAPTNEGLSLDVFGMTMTTVSVNSGLTAATARVEFQLRIMKDMKTQPEDSIDFDVLAAADEVMNALVGGYTLDGEIFAVDVLGAYGEALRAEAGYITIGGGAAGSGGRMFRVMDVFVPIVIDNCWTYGE